MRRFFLLLALVSSSAFSQINESFNDGNFNDNPVWFGDDSHFIITTEGELQLNASIAGESALFTSSLSLENARWSFQLRMDFNPSSANFTRIYLASDNATISEIQNAIYIEIGGTDDNVCLYTLTNGNKERIIEGTIDRVDNSIVNIAVQVIRTNDSWLLQSNIGSGYIDEGSVTFSPQSPSAYFGIYCKYTKTRIDKFFFDNIIVEGEPYKDKNPPLITNFNFVNGSQIQLTFNEPIELSSITKEAFTLKNSQRQAEELLWDAESKSITLNYDPRLEDVENEELTISKLKDIDDNSIVDTTLTFSYESTKLNAFKLINSNTLEIGFTKSIPSNHFSEAILTIDGDAASFTSITDIGDQKYYHLTINRRLSEAISYTFELNNLFDAVGDEVDDIKATLSYYFAKRFDVVFNELMIDPSPSMGLPETEFIELYNTSNQAIGLANWVLSVNNKASILPEITIQANNFICLIPSSSVDEWAEQGNTVDINNWPNLSNTACDIILYDNRNNVIDAYQYKREAIIGEIFKTDGGWSIEKLDPDNVSYHVDNMHWSLNLNGGTPGVINSVVRNNPDQTPPFIEHLEMKNDTLLQINFSETMYLFDDFNITLQPHIDNYKITFDSVFLKNIKLHFNQAPQTNQTHHITKLNLSDYAGHPLVLEDDVYFGIPDTLEKGDVLINEVLFNPYTDGVDFVELINTSDKLLAVSDIYLAGITNETIDKLYRISTTNQLFLPHSYLVVTTDKIILQEHYQCENSSTIYEVNTLPSLPDDEGIVAISNNKGQLLDFFNYSSNMHFDLIKDDEGVSLERLSLTQVTNEPSNWHSAASTAGYATPTHQNSQTIPEKQNNDDTFSISPEVFSPNGNGIDDLLYINYNNAEIGGTVTIRIYNSNGTPVKYLANNVSMANEGYIIWDGLSDSGEALHPSIYIIYIQGQYPSGKKINEKHSCVIGIESTQ